jgi:hypothetical protein
MLTRAERAQEARILEALIQDIGRPEVDAPIGIIWPLSEALGVTPDELVFGEPAVSPGNPG